MLLLLHGILEKKVFKSMFGSFLFIVFSINSYDNVSWPVAALHVLIITCNELSLFSGSYLVMRCAIIYSLNYDGRFFFYLVLIFGNFYFVLDLSFFSLLTVYLFLCKTINFFFAIIFIYNSSCEISLFFKTIWLLLVVVVDVECVDSFCKTYLWYSWGTCINK